MIDWRVTPGRLASLSRDSIIHTGKSTLPPSLCLIGAPSPGQAEGFRDVFAIIEFFDQASWLSWSSTSSFRERLTEMMRSPVARRYNGRTVLAFDRANNQQSRFVARLGGDLDKERVKPASLCIKGVNPMLGLGAGIEGRSSLRIRVKSPLRRADSPPHSPITHQPSTSSTGTGSSASPWAGPEMPSPLSRRKQAWWWVQINSSPSRLRMLLPRPSSGRY